MNSVEFLHLIFNILIYSDNELKYCLELGHLFILFTDSSQFPKTTPGHWPDMH